VGVSIEVCILIGVFTSFLLAVPRAGRMTRTEFVVSERGVVRERAEGEPVNDRLLLFGLEGELFFGSAMALDGHLTWFENRAAAGAKVVVLRVKRLRNPDAVGMREIDLFIRRMKDAGVRVILAGVRSDLLAGLRRAGTLDIVGPDQVFPERQAKGSSTMEAVAAAHAFLHGLEAGAAAQTSPTFSHFQV
jgi:MFS superfamily sulfate permease-like transporter